MHIFIVNISFCFRIIVRSTIVGNMYWFCKCIIGLAVLAISRTAILPGGSQKCVPPGPGLTLNDFLSGKFYLFERQQEFSIKLLQTAVAASPKQNLIFSPHSIYTALLITYFLSSNKTEEKLKSFLNLPPEQVQYNCNIVLSFIPWSHQRYKLIVFPVTVS